MNFNDLSTQYKRISADVHSKIDAVLSHGQFILGPEVTRLEQTLADYVGVKHCITCSSGTDALLLPLMAKGIGPGDAVFVPTFAFIATAEVVSLLGATPVFIDIDPRTFNIDIAALQESIQSIEKGARPSPGSPGKLVPRCIIPVDMFGLPADYDRINDIARAHNLFVVEDAAQSFGALYKNRKTCSLAPVAATSFFPSKPLGCYGDGGAMFTQDDEHAAVLRSLRAHGKGADKYDNIRIGINGRLDTLQAAILLAKMAVFPDEIRKRQDVASRYTVLLQGMLETPQIPAEYTSAWAQYSVLSDRRDATIACLRDKGIPTAVYYPKPLHLQTAFKNLGYESGSLPVAEDVSRRVFSLPMHPYLEEDEQGRIVKAAEKL